MNREFLPEAIIGITAGLLIAVFAVYRSDQALKPGTIRRGGMVAVLVYAVIAAPVIVRGGMTWWGLLLLLVLLCLPVVGLLLAPVRVEGTAAVWARRIVSVGLAAAMLIAAGQSLSLVGIVDPRVLVVVVAVVAALLVAREGLVASGRVGSLAVWLLIVPVLISLALGIFLGDLGQAVNRIIEVQGPSWWQLLALAVAFLVLGAADTGLAHSRSRQTWSPVRVLVGVCVVVLMVGIGLLMFFGGAILAPSMQFFVVPANIDAVPGLAAVLIAVLTVLFAALVSSTLTGLHTDGDDSWRWVTIGAVVAVLLALVDPGLEWVVVAASLAAAAVVLARSARGVATGIVGAAIATAVLTVTATMSFGWQSTLAALIVLAVSTAIPAPDQASASSPQPRDVTAPKA